ncbi:MAG TPA: dipeptidase [Thermomicrobiales bacterium]|nr:dipeptidase [Thermomicrobiales bacterium]
MTTAQEYLDQRQDRNLEQVMELLRIPSVSTDPAHAGDVHSAAEWIAERMRAIGVPEVRLVDTPRHPLVYGKWHAAPGAPTILVYGHYDVQPVDPLNEWVSPPFEPTIRDDRIYARGAADMKANLVTLLQAVEALAGTSPIGAPPINLTFLWEGEEEIGSPSAPAVVEAMKDELAADVIMSCDGGMYDGDTGALWISFKGLAAIELIIRTGSTDLHSGGYGAVVPNAAQVLAQVAASMHDDHGRVAVPGFYDGVVELSDADRAEIAAMAPSDDALRRETSVKALWGEPGYTPEERRSARPTLDINGYWSGFQGAGGKTVTPCLGHIKITCRLVPDQDPDRIAKLIAAHAQSVVPAGVTVEPRFSERNGRGYAISRDNPFLARLGEVLEAEYGTPARVVRVGGSVPITAMFRQLLRRETITLGFLLPASNVHAPNEWFRISDLNRARSVYASFLSGWQGEDIGTGVPSPGVRKENGQ